MVSKTTVVVALLAVAIGFVALRPRPHSPALDAEGREISGEPLPQKRVEVLGKSMAYSDVGEGDVFLFLHGNPTQGYLWRNVIPHVCPAHGRCIAPDLIGMGNSDKLEPELAADGAVVDADSRYSFDSHARFLDAFIDAVVGDAPVTLVVQDWGSGLGFYWAHRHEDRVKGIAFFEAVVRVGKLAEAPAPARVLFGAMRAPWWGEKLVVGANMFIELILPMFAERRLTEEEMTVYRAPYVNGGEDRRPTLTWPRMIPFEESGPEMTVSKVNAYRKWLSTVDTFPKLFMRCSQGAILEAGNTAEINEIASWPRVTGPKVVRGVHFCQEDDPHTIGGHIHDWLVAQGR